MAGDDNAECDVAGSHRRCGHAGPRCGRRNIEADIRRLHAPIGDLPGHRRRAMVQTAGGDRALHHVLRANAGPHVPAPKALVVMAKDLRRPYDPLTKASASGGGASMSSAHRSVAARSAKAAMVREGFAPTGPGN